MLRDRSRDSGSSKIGELISREERQQAKAALFPSLNTFISDLSGGWKVLPTLGEGLPTLVNSSRKCPRSLARGHTH